MAAITHFLLRFIIIVRVKIKFKNFINKKLNIIHLNDPLQTDKGKCISLNVNYYVKTRLQYFETNEINYHYKLII